MSGKEALNLPRRLEPLHDPLSSSGRLMGVFGPVIEALVLPMLDPGHDLPLGSGVALQLVGDEHTRGSTLLLEELAEQAEKAKGGNPNLSRRPTGSTLSDLGITRDQSSQWQRLAAVPEPEFEAALAGSDKPTTNGRRCRSSVPLTVRNVIGKLREPKYWERGLDPSLIPVHPNHWCMVPKSKNFTTRGALVQGTARGRSFRTLDWTQPSPTVAYGNREVHVHPSGPVGFQSMKLFCFKGSRRSSSLLEPCLRRSLK